MALDRDPAGTIAYIAGPMTGRDNYNYDAFNAIEGDLRLQGFEYVNNPARHFNGDQGLPWTVYIDAAMNSLLESNVLLAMSGWQDSIGATLEVLMALGCGHDIYTVISNQDGYEYREWDVDDRRAMVGVLVGINRHIEDRREAENLPHEEAAQLVHGARQANYGHPVDNFTGTAGIWNGIIHKKLKEPLTAEDVALCMVGVKLSRETHVPKRDNLVDAHGYLMTYQMVKDERIRRAEENTSVAGQTSRELNLLKTERQRRRLKQ